MRTKLAPMPSTRCCSCAFGPALTLTPRRMTGAPLLASTKRTPFVVTHGAAGPALVTGGDVRPNATATSAAAAPDSHLRPIGEILGHGAVGHEPEGPTLTQDLQNPALLPYRWTAGPACVGRAATREPPIPN